MGIRKAWSWETLGDGIRAWEDPSSHVEDFARRLKTDGAKRVYDLGCGIGRHTALLAEAGFDVYATDLSTAGVRMTLDRLRDRGLQAVVVVADMTAVPMDRQTFDGVLAFNVVYHATRRDVVRAIGETARVLRPGGIAMITFQSTRSSKFGSGRRLGDNTFVPMAGHEAGIPHFFAAHEDVRGLLDVDFRVEALEHLEVSTEASTGAERNCHWMALARRK